MKKLKFRAIALVLFVTIGFVSCNDDDDNSSPITKKSFVSVVTGPTTGTINQELTLTVTFAVDNSCGTFNKYVETTKSETTKEIEVEAKYEGSNCGTTAVTKTGSYKFKAAKVGTYILKFKKSATEFVTQTVEITATK